jgi:hypothetical protein
MVLRLATRDEQWVHWREVAQNTLRQIGHAGIGAGRGPRVGRANLPSDGARVNLSCGRHAQRHAGQIATATQNHPGTEP